MKSKNGETTLADVVKSIHDLTKAMNAGFAAVTHEVAEINGRLHRQETRFERSLVTAGTRGLDHEARIAQLEDDVAELKGLYLSLSPFVELVTCSRRHLVGLVVAGPR